MSSDVARLATVDLLGGRRFWVVQSRDLPGGALGPLHAELAARSDPEDAGTLGVVVLVPPSEAGRRPDAEWPDPRTLHAGRLGDGTQVRVAYFDGAVVRPREVPAIPLSRWMVDDGPELLVFGEQDRVTAQDVVDLWTGEGVLPPDEAQRRVEQVAIVAVQGDRVVGVTTTYLGDSAQLGVPVHYGRGFVAASERRKATAGRLLIRLREHLEERFVTGRDTRAAALVLEVENPVLRTMLPEATWPGSDFTWIGTNERGDDVRVKWFPGARVPW